VSKASSGAQIEFQANLPYSASTFNTAVQEKFKVAVAAECRAGSVCHMSKEQVEITNIVENNVPRRRLQATSISVGVIVFVESQADGDRIIGFLSKDNLNRELETAGVEPIAFLVSVPTSVVKSTLSGFEVNSILILISVLVGVLAVVTFILGMICQMRYRGSSKTVFPDIQGAEHRAGVGPASEQQNLPRTLALNAGWVRGDCEPLESQQTSESVNKSEPSPSLQPHMSSRLLEEEINLFQTASQKKARLEDAEDSQGICELQDELARVKTTDFDFSCFYYWKQ